MKHLRSMRRLITKPASVPFALLLALGTSAPIAGCAIDQPGSADAEEAGSLGLNLEVAPGITLSSVSYTVTGNGFTKTGSIDIGNSPTISATIGGIPAGTGYTIELSGTSLEDGTTLSGSATFNVTAGDTASVTVHLKGSGSTKKGSVLVNGTLNVGPVIDDLTATPTKVFVGGEVALTG